GGNLMKQFLAPFVVLLISGTAAFAQTRELGDTNVPSSEVPSEVPRDAPATSQPTTRGHANFSDADIDGDGQLSIEEMGLALPELTIEDSNGDGLANQQEAETALPELRFADRGHEGGEATIGEVQFNMIVRALNERDEDTI